MTDLALNTWDAAVGFLIPPRGGKQATPLDIARFPGWFAPPARRLKVVSADTTERHVLDVAWFFARPGARLSELAPRGAKSHEVIVLDAAVQFLAPKGTKENATIDIARFLAPPARRENGEDYAADFLIMLNTWDAAVSFLLPQGSKDTSMIDIARVLGWGLVRKKGNQSGDQLSGALRHRRRFHD
jgi:hypothetical protein